MALLPALLPAFRTRTLPVLATLLALMVMIQNKLVGQEATIVYPETRMSSQVDD